MRLHHTIAACITGPGPGAVAIVRLSGPLAWEIAETVFAPWPQVPEPFRARYGRFCTGDDGFILPFAEGASYTGEQSVELSIHGSRASIRAMLEALVAAGARMAEPGEFTLRAFLNGRIDLTQAEGVKALVEAEADAQLRQGLRLRDGELRRQIAGLRDSLAGVLAAIEASTDFSDEVGPLDKEAASLALSGVQELIARLLAAARQGRLAAQGLRIVLAGRPNAGKSSLLNALLRSDRAIVTPEAGTTRDTLEEAVELGGVRCVLVDSAGLRQGGGLVEQLGIDRARQAMEEADIVWYLAAADEGLSPEDQAVLDSLSRPFLVIASKCDLAASRPAWGLPVSAVTGDGLDDLGREVEAGAGLAEAPAILPRHEPLLRQAQEAVGEAQAALDSSLPTDLAAVPIQAALRQLGEITGETAAPDVVERIFRDFCIGK